MKAYTSLSEIQSDLATGSISCVELVDFYLEKIAEQKHLNAFVEVYEQEAVQAAHEVDKKLAEGKAGKLSGAVIALKDVLCHKDHHLQGSSKILEGFESQFTGTAVERLLKEDAIIIGRNGCDEFAMGSSNENSAFGPVRNADDTNKVPGGSSGGSAVAVQADMCLASLGSDTGGSVRQPAAFCNIYGLKPTYSRISRYGLIAYASSFDCIGIFGKSPNTVAKVLEVIAGPDEYDSTVSQTPISNYSSFKSGSYKIAYIKETIDAEGLAPEIKEQTLSTLEKMKKAGHKVEEVQFPLLDQVLPTYYILTTAEASSNLSRFDGVKYGYRSPNTTDLESMYKKSRSEGFGAEVKRRIMLGTFVLSASYYDAYYTKAQKVRNLIRKQTKQILKEYDFIALPTTPTTAFNIGEHTENPLEMYLADLFTVQSSVAGVPAISIPNGKDKSGMGIGLQLMTDDFEEEKLLSFSHQLAEMQKK